MFVPISINGTSQQMTADTYVYTGLSITIPANNYYAIRAIAVWVNSQPSGVRISTSNQYLTKDNTVSTNDEGSETSVVGITTNNPITYYVWGRWIYSTNNYARINGFRIPS